MELTEEPAAAPPTDNAAGGGTTGEGGGDGRAGWSRRRKWLTALLAAFTAFVVLVVAAVVWVYTLPLPNPHPLLQATLVYGANGQLIGEFSEQNRVDVPLRAVPKVVIDAVVSTEDRHFFSEGAVNPVSTARALIADLSGSHLQGGSTITQQYVKQAYLSPKRTLTRKIREAAIAYRVAQKQSKSQILDEYLNTIYWGRGAYGVQAAAQAYFGRNVGQLNLQEAALLAGLIREPETADPSTHPDVARTNQADTLKAMVRDKKITPAQAAAARAVPFSTYVLPPGSTGSKAAQASGDDYFMQAVREELYQKYGRSTVDGGGLRVTTTLDPTLQARAYDAVYGHGPHALDPAKGTPSGAMVSLDDAGHVLALVGGPGLKYSSVDLALGAAGGGSGRQAGSTFKAIMLAEVIKEGYSVMSKFRAPPTISIPNGTASGGTWKVTNYDGEALAPVMNLVDATAYSVNTVYAQVVETIGAAKLDAMAEALGINPSELPHPYLSQVLGTAAVSPLEMAGAYSALAAGGIYHKPILITSVTTASGRHLPLPVATSSRKVLNGSETALEDYVLEQVVAHGTGVAAGGIGSAVAGKTGTTENSGDAWFIGYTPKITTAMWMGYANSVKSMDGFRGLTSVTGGSIPAQIWHDYMAAAIAAEPQYAGSFPAPGDLNAGQMLVAGAPLAPSPTSVASSTTAPTSTSTSTSTSTPTTAPPITASQPVRTTVAPAPAPPPTTVPAPVAPTTTAAGPTTTTTTTTTPSQAAASSGGTTTGSGTGSGTG